jgi:hypothetical protein
MHQSRHAYELSFPVYGGLSGAPLLAKGPSIIGVIYGNIDSHMVVEEASRDPDTGETRPEARRIISFGLAFHNDVLCNVQNSVTNGMPLIDYCGR